MTKRYAVVGDIVAEHTNGQLVHGAAAAIAMCLRDLGGDVTLRSRIGNDDAGTALLAEIKAARIHPKNIDVQDGATSSLRRLESGAYEDWSAGAIMAKDAMMDIYALFGHDALVLDALDQPLRRFLIDLPAHTDGTVRMLTTLRHLDFMDPSDDELDVAMRCDTIIGTEAQYSKLTGRDHANDSLGDIFERMPLTHLRAAIAITPNGLDCISREGRVIKPIQDAVPVFLVPQVSAGIAWGMAHHADWDQALTVAIDPEMAT